MTLNVLVNIEADPLDTNADTNLHEQRRTPAVRKQEKSTVLEGVIEFLIPIERSVALSFCNSAYCQ